jgi:conjugative relaxase-like TrwC/TraI family protein
MLSMSKAMKAGAGIDYFDVSRTSEGYYHDENKSRWIGDGAEMLGLSGVVKKPNFDTVLMGRDPQTFKKLVKSAGSKNHRGYFDLTFSAPKSMSILHLVDDRLELAQNLAVERTAAKIAKEYAFTRRAGEQKNTMVIKNLGRLVMARFSHYENRELDPQLHTHVPTMNLVLDENGKGTTLEPKKLFDDHFYLGQVYRNELAKCLRELGYKIEPSKDETKKKEGCFEIAGVPQSLIDLASERRKQMEERLEYNNDRYADERWYKKLSEFERKELATEESRKYKGEINHDQVRKDNIERLEAALGYSLVELRDQAKRLAIESPDPDPPPVKDCVRRAIEDETDKNSSFLEKDIIDRVLKQTLGHYTADQVIDEFHRQQDVHRIREGNKFKEQVYTTAEVMEAERWSWNYAETGIGKSGVAITPEETDDLLSEQEAKPRSGGKPITLSDGQRAAVKMICATKDRVSVVQGDAGSGKTTAMEFAKDILTAKGIGIRGLAPTAAASGELAKVLGKASTIDRLLASEKEQAAIQPGEVWIVDESSMVGSLNMHKILQLAEKNEAKVVLVGDTKQFMAVAQGKIFGELQDKTHVDRVEITEVKRQKTQHTRDAVAAIKEQNFAKAFDVLDNHGCLTEINHRDDRIKCVLDKYREYTQDDKECFILTGTNKDRTEINNLIRDELEAKGKIVDSRAFNTFVRADVERLDKCFARKYSAGQILILRKECGDIPQGTQVTILHPNKENDTLTVQYYDKKLNKYQKTDIDVRQHYAKYDVYNVVEKRFGVGDRVIFNKNDRGVGVSNGQTGVIRKFQKDGTAVIDIGRKKVKCNLNNTGANAYNYLDHGYCITTHKSQGASIDNVIVYTDLDAMATNYNAFYVMTTRVKENISLITNDKQKLMEQAKEWQDKASTLDDIAPVPPPPATAQDAIEPPPPPPPPAAPPVKDTSLPIQPPPATAQDAIEPPPRRSPVMWPTEATTPSSTIKPPPPPPPPPPAALPAKDTASSAQTPAPATHPAKDLAASIQKTPPTETKKTADAPPPKTPAPPKNTDAPPIIVKKKRKYRKQYSLEKIDGYNSVPRADEDMRGLSLRDIANMIFKLEAVNSVPAVTNIIKGLSVEGLFPQKWKGIFSGNDTEQGIYEKVTKFIRKVVGTSNRRKKRRIRKTKRRLWN